MTPPTPGRWLETSREKKRDVSSAKPAGPPAEATLAAAAAKKNETVATSLADEAGGLAAAVFSDSAGARVAVAASVSTTAARAADAASAPSAFSVTATPACWSASEDRGGLGRPSRPRARFARAPFGRRPRSPGADADTSTARLCVAARATARDGALPTAGRLGPRATAGTFAAHITDMSPSSRPPASHLRSERPVDASPAQDAAVARASSLEPVRARRGAE
mmetsp:Transcript_9741/g.40925  ORF Transcript_9741/g.40925 Transcript_9741/m.40925 type:complete len:222 (-) Transcript_9741:10-675(-)